MDEKALMAILDSFADQFVQLRAIQLLLDCKIEVLLRNLEVVGKAVGAKWGDASSPQEFYRNAVTKIVNQKLAAWADDDPEMAAAYKRVIETGETGLPPIQK